MKGIVSFEFDSNYIDVYEYAAKSNKSYGYVSCRNFQEFIDSQHWLPSKVGKKEGHDVDSNIRNSMYINNVKLKIYNNEQEQIIENLKQLVPQKYKHCILQDNYLKFEAIKYTKGCFFAKHKDTLENDLHFATVIIIPPVKLVGNHTGGLLSIQDENGNIQEFDSSKNEKWLVVAFNPSLEHSCSEITEGTRIIFKTTWSFNEKLFNLTKGKPISLDICQNTEKSENKEEKNKLFYDVKENMLKILNSFESNFDKDYDYCDEIAELRTCITDLEEFNNTRFGNELDNNDYVIDSLKLSGKKINIVVLNNYYSKTQLEWLYPNDFELYKKLKEKYDNITFKNFTCSYTNDEIDEDSELGMYYRNKNVDIFNTHKKGKYLYSTTEYNDNTYDKITNYSVSAFIIHQCETFKH